MRPVPVRPTYVDLGLVWAIGLVMGIALHGTGSAVPRPQPIEPGYYCLGSPSGPRVYAPGAMNPARDAAYVIHGRHTTYIQVEYLHPCQGEQDT